MAPLRVDDSLNGLAMGWAAEMAKSNRMGHGDFENRFNLVYPNTAGAENIAMGRDIPQVVAMWMGDPPHRANNLGRYNIAGAGFATSNAGATYWCIDFAMKP